ncbi:PAS domain-containing sensor histidine kinase [Sneathiella sp.]|uniref:sensor histidine kinase n=1 Tax=Sneathiella sp. TaxID=1964365 RepID=UPI002634A177|nr:PAS domain-containing sensor histidine kinase [Sneathiella sp.]MDF2367460.1 PAS domain-containing sensor histidine kinase [Sneathiella sp.]
MNAKGYKRIGFAVLGIMLLVSVAGGLYSINLAQQYGEERNRLIEFEQDLVEKTRLNNTLENAFGYGGFIHNFKNFVLRHDPVYQLTAEKKFDEISQALAAYRELPLSDEEHQAIEDVLVTLREYRVNLDRAAAFIAGGMTVKEIDRLVRVDDTNAVAALAVLNGVWDKSFADRFAFLDEMMAMEEREIVIVQLTIAGFILFALALFWWIIKYESAWLQTLRLLRASETKFRQIISNSADAIITTNKSGQIEVFNRAAERFFGYTEDEVVGHEVSILLPPTDRAEMDTFFSQPAQTAGVEENVSLGLNAWRKDGSSFPIESHTAAYNFDGKKTYVSIIRDITEQKKSEEMLINTMKSAIDAHKAKNLFIANMNHELRTPLNAIIGYSDMMLMETFGKLPSEKYREYAADINGSGKHLLAIISDLLDLGAIEEGKLQLEKEFFDLAEIVNESLKMIMQQANENGVTVRYNKGDFDFSIFADARRVRQILLNILSNSIKFTLKGGVISMTCAQHDDEVILSVDDTGVGVAEKDLPTIFEPFVQATESHLTTKDGTGLGLSLSRTLVELHGGTMEFISELGKGSRVTIRLPNAPYLQC